MITPVVRNSRTAAIAAGAIGGLLGAWFKLGRKVTWPPRAPDRIAEPMLLVTMFTHVPTPVWTPLVINFVFSILCGVAFALLVEFFPIVAIGAGVGFGLAIWIGAHEVVMPLMRLTPPAWELPTNEQGSEFYFRDLGVKAGLAGLGIPNDSIVRYQTAVKAGKFLVIAHGTREEADRAKDILTHAGLAVPDVHAAATV